MQRSPVKGGSRVRADVVQTIRRKELQPRVNATVEGGSAIYTDALASYEALAKEYMHEVIDHSKCYARGMVHTNGMENFWSLLKRGLKGTYVSVEPFHLLRYVDEQVFRFNGRQGSDGSRFVQVLKSIVGRRLTYKALIESPMPETC